MDRSPTCTVEVPMADGARVAAFVYAPEGVADEPGTPFAVTWNPAPLVMLHGNGEDHGHLAELIGRLGAGRSVIALDSRGHGRSTRGSEPLSYELMARDTLEVMSRLGVTQAHVLGFSDGGIVTLLLARDVPSRVLSCTALGANLSPEGLSDVARVGMRAALVAAPLLPARPGACSEAELLRLMLEQPHIDAASLGSITCPTLVMAGGHDLVKPDETRRIAAAVPGSRLEVVEPAGHDLPHDAPAEVAKAAAELIAQADGRSRPRGARRLVTFRDEVPVVAAASPDVAVVRATLRDEPGVCALYERLLDSCEVPGRETCGWRRGFWPLPDDVARRLRAGTTWVAVAREDVASGSAREGARILGAMSLDDDFGLDGVEPAWERLAAGEALTCHLLATDPDARGRGVATALLAAYAREGIRRGCRALRINTSPQSLSNRLYHELGFTLWAPVRFPYEGLPLTPWTCPYELRLDDGGGV